MPALPGLSVPNLAGAAGPLSGILGAIGNLPQEISAWNQLKMQAAQMRQAKFENSLNNAKTLSAMGMQIPALASDPKFQAAMDQQFKNLGMSGAPRDSQGNIDLSGLDPVTMTPQTIEMFQKIPPENRQAAWDGMFPGRPMPSYINGINYSAPDALVTSFQNNAAKLVQDVAKGGDPKSALDTLDSMQAPSPQAKQAAINAINNAASSPQAKLAFKTQQENEKKTEQEANNAYLTGQYTQAGIGLRKEQQKHEEASTQEAYASAHKDYASANEALIRSQKEMLDETKELATMTWDRQHGVPPDQNYYFRLQTMQDNASKRIGYWNTQRQDAAKSVSSLRASILEAQQGTDPITGKPFTTPAAQAQAHLNLQAALNSALAAQKTANQGFFAAQQHQKHVEAIVSGPPSPVQHSTHPARSQEQMLADPQVGDIIQVPGKPSLRYNGHTWLPVQGNLNSIAPPPAVH